MKFILTVGLFFTLNNLFAQLYCLQKQAGVTMNDNTYKNKGRECRIINLIKEFSDPDYYKDSILVTIKIFADKYEQINDSDKEKILQSCIRQDSLFKLAAFYIAKDRLLDVAEFNSPYLLSQNFHIVRTIYFINEKNELIRITGKMVVEYYWITGYIQESVFQTNHSVINIYSKKLNIDFSLRTRANKAYWDFYNAYDAAKSGKVFLNARLDSNLFEFYRCFSMCRDCGLEQPESFILYKPGIGIVGYKGHIPFKGELEDYSSFDEEIYDFK